MRVILWYPGASVAVADVAAGLHAGLEANGVAVTPYRLDHRIDMAAAALGQAYESQRAAGLAVTEPTKADVYYHANMGVLERALRYDAEWVCMVSGLYQHPDYAVMLRRAGRRVALFCTESPYNVRQELAYAQHVDHVFVNERSMVATYRAVNPNTTYLPCAWHPTVHTQMAHADDTDVPAHDVVFVGTGFIERVRLLEAIAEEDIDLGVYGAWELVEPDSTLMARLPTVNGQPQTSQFIPNARTAALYRRATVGLNLHRTSIEMDIDTAHVSGAESLNPRCYELAACGRFFVTDARAEVRDVFGSDLPTFETPAQAIALIRRALANPSWREDVAATCRERVAGHSWTARAATALEALTRQRAGVAA